jgi:TatD DNase family protein
MPLIDSHAHLDSRQFDGDREAVIARARQTGLVAIVNAGASLVSSRAAAALADRYDFIYATVGIHPHDAKTANRAALAELRALASHPKVVAVGEIGLDYYRDLSPHPVQRRAFADQLALATELGLPVVIHSRSGNHDYRAHDDVLDMLRDWAKSPPCPSGASPPRAGGTGTMYWSPMPRSSASPPRAGGTEGGRRGVLHSYAAGPERLDEVLEMGFYIGISGPVTFKKAERLREVAAKVPLNRLLIETDCPYLTPEPYRGKRNEPAYVRYVAQTIARARNVTPRKIALATTDNARRLFGIDG